MAKARILVVEDDVLIASDIEQILEDNGGVCMDIRTAEAFVRNTPVDAVLLDVLMRDETSSYNLCKVLEKLDIPFGFVSGIPRHEIDDEWRNRPHLEKPFRDADILELAIELAKNEGQSRVSINNWSHQRWPET